MLLTLVFRHGFFHHFEELFVEALDAELVYDVFLCILSESQVSMAVKVAHRLHYIFDVLQISLREVAHWLFCRANYVLLRARRRMRDGDEPGCHHLND